MPEVRVVGRIDHLKPIARLKALGDAEALEDAKIHVLIAIPQEGYENSYVVTNKFVTT